MTSTCRPSCAAEVSVCLPVRDKPASKHRGLTPMRPGGQQIPDTSNVSVRIRRVTTTRAGGVSKPPFDTFNLGDHVGDDPAAVAANRERLAKAIGVGAAAVDETDGLVTTTPRLALAVVTADCVPVLLADARAGVVGAVHAGRVGAQKGVVARAVESMCDAGARAEAISVLLGPSVSGRNYEVPAAMAAEVEAALPGSRTTTSRGTPGLDLRAGIARQLRELGVAAIDADPRCTVDDRNLFSHRRDAPTGRLASVVWME